MSGNSFSRSHFIPPETRLCLSFTFDFLGLIPFSHSFRFFQGCVGVLPRQHKPDGSLVWNVSRVATGELPDLSEFTRNLYLRDARRQHPFHRSCVPRRPSCALRFARRVRRVFGHQLSAVWPTPEGEEFAAKEPVRDYKFCE